MFYKIKFKEKTLFSLNSNHPFTAQKTQKTKPPTIFNESINDLIIISIFLSYQTGGKYEPLMPIIHKHKQNPKKKRNKFSILRSWGAAIISYEIEKQEPITEFVKNENRNLTDLREANRS